MNTLGQDSIMQITAKSLKNIKEFKDHENVSFLFDTQGVYGLISVHKGNQNTPCFGSTRVRSYNSFLDGLTDALRLSKMMTYKLALARLPYGGGSAVLFHPPGEPLREDVSSTQWFFKKYGKDLLKTPYFFTGSDTGMTTSAFNDIAECSEQILGKRLDPIKFTGIGIISSLKECLLAYYGTEDLNNRTILVEGLGKLGCTLIEHLYSKTKRLIGIDISDDQCKKARARFPNLEIIKPDDKFKEKVDVYCPCAYGPSVTKANINKINTDIIIGAANCQLESDELAVDLFEKNILYAPDYVVNSGGVIAVIHEYRTPEIQEEHVYPQVFDIRNTLKTIIADSSMSNVPPLDVANKYAIQRIAKLSAY